MPLVRIGYSEVVDALTPILAGLPPSVIAITGPMLSGKTTLGRYLAWHFNVALIETDLLLVSATPWAHDVETLKRLIEIRRGMKRPVIVEGLVSLRLLSSIETRADFVISLVGTTPAAVAPFGDSSVELDVRTLEVPYIQLALHE